VGLKSGEWGASYDLSICSGESIRVFRWRYFSGHGTNKESFGGLVVFGKCFFCIIFKKF